MTKARDIMTPGVEFIGTDATIAEAARKLGQHDIGALPVGNADGRLHGMLTDRDIVVRVVAVGKDPETTKVGDIVATTEVATVGADDPVEDALRTMKEHKVRRLPVVDGNKVVGMVSQGDIATNLPEAKVGDLVETISAAP